MGFFGGTSKKVLLSVAAVGVSAGIAGLGTFASFTSTTSASQTVASGTVTIALGTPGAANRLTVNASGLVPGDTVQRAFTLSNTGDQDLASIGLTTAASPSSLLDTDTTNGLQLVVDRCPTPWVETGVSPAFSYTCALGLSTTVISSRPVIGSNLTMAGLSSLTSGGSDNLRVTLTLPSSAGNSLQGLSSTLTYTFLGTQRTAGAR